jgi:hypothetical protein
MYKRHLALEGKAVTILVNVQRVTTGFIDLCALLDE